MLSCSLPNCWKKYRSRGKPHATTLDKKNTLSVFCPESCMPLEENLTMVTSLSIRGDESRFERVFRVLSLRNFLSPRFFASYLFFQIRIIRIIGIGDSACFAAADVFSSLCTLAADRTHRTHRTTLKNPTPRECLTIRCLRSRPRVLFRVRALSRARAYE